MNNKSIENGEHTLEQIEDKYWGDPPETATKLMKIVFSLRKKPLQELTTEDLRLLLSQQEGIGVLVPRALEILRFKPLAEGDYYPGDLLVALLKVRASYWRINSDQTNILGQVISSIEGMGDLADQNAPADVISLAIKDFNSSCS